MNRNELVEFLRDPSSLSSENLEELEKIAAEAPYFQSVRMLLAKGSKMLNDPSAKKRVGTAAIYATDRALLKKYISGNLLFLTNPPEGKTKKAQEAEPTNPEEKEERKAGFRPPREKYQFPKPKESKEPEPEPDELEGKIVIPGIPEGALDGILDELEQDMEDLKSSRMKFADMQQQIEEEDAVSAALEKATAITPDQETPTLEQSVPDEMETAEKPAKASALETSTEEDAVDEEPEIDTDEQIDDPEDFPKHEIISNFTDDDEFEDETDDLVIADFKSSEEEEEEEVEPKPSKKEKTKEPEAADVATESIVVEEEKKSEEEEIVENSAAKNSESPKEEPQKDPKREEKPSLDSDLSVPPVRLESEIKREERRERRANREKKLSNVNELSESSLKKLEDQMWGDSDDEVSRSGEKKSQEPTKESSSKKSALKEEKPKKEATKKKTVASKSTKKATTKPPAKKKATTTKKAATKTTVKVSAKKDSSAKSSAAKSTSKAKKTTTKKKKDDDDGKAHPARGQEQIIDKFIKESPSISKPGDRAKADKDLSDQSSAWNKELASEYLAEIYLQQGNKKRAVEIYHTLSLNFPEKKSYFADLISKIK